MKETLELRVLEEHANRLFSPEEGRRLGDSVRIIKVDVNDPRFELIAQLRHTLDARGELFFSSWQYLRQYTPEELANAELFRTKITAVFEPAGEMCGTRYDEAVACPICGAGRTQLGPLTLDLRKAPKTRQIARTIANEWIVSQQLAELMIDARITGAELHPVVHKARYQDDPIDLTTVPSGRELLALAEAAGCPHPTWSFWVWLNRPEQRELSRSVDAEHVARMNRKSKRRPNPPAPWYQLIVSSQPAHIAKSTRFGINPFDLDDEGQYRCPKGHVLGLNMLSEAYILRDSWDNSDIVITKELVGWKQGVLRAAPVLLISPRFRRLLIEYNIKGWRTEVARLV